VFLGSPLDCQLVNVNQVIKIRIEDHGIDFYGESAIGAFLNILDN
jgi:hypothetical protein